MTLPEMKETAKRSHTHHKATREVEGGTLVVYHDPGAVEGFHDYSYVLLNVEEQSSKSLTEDQAASLLEN